MKRTETTGVNGVGNRPVSAAAEDNAIQDADEPLAEVPWDGTLDGETIELKEDEE
ncbi:MAG: hypothetical protein AB9917_13420 [Negativicutes bacterium]